MIHSLYLCVVAGYYRAAVFWQMSCLFHSDTLCDTM